MTLSFAQAKNPFSQHKLANIDNIAKRYAEAHKSDPFAFNRIRSHMLQRIELPSDVLKEAVTILEARAKRVSFITTSA